MARSAVAPIARSPIAPAPPVEVVDGWEVSVRRSEGKLRMADLTPLAKMLVRHEAPFVGVEHGRTRRDGDVLTIGSGPGEWTLLGPPGSARELLASVPADGFTSVVDVTHGRALVRLTGASAPSLLAKVCAINLSDRATPDGSAFRSSVAKLVTDVVRDDVGGERSYLLHCERSSGQYLWDSLLDAGEEHGIDIDGFRGDLPQ